MRGTHLEQVREVDQHLGTILLPTSGVEARCGNVLSSAPLGEIHVDGEVEEADGNVLEVLAEAETGGELGDSTTTCRREKMSENREERIEEKQETNR
jgi:hypothetical protein